MAAMKMVPLALVVVAGSLAATQSQRPDFSGTWCWSRRLKPRSGRPARKKRLPRLKQPSRSGIRRRAADIN